MYIDDYVFPGNRTIVKSGKSLKELEQDLNKAISKAYRFNQTMECDGNSFTITLDVPGFSKENLVLTYDNEILTVTLLKPEDQAETKIGSQVFRLKSMDPNTFKAKCEHGRLTITGSKLTSHCAITIKVE